MLGKEYSLSYHCFFPFKNGLEDLDKIKKKTNKKQSFPHLQPTQTNKTQKAPQTKSPQTNKQNHTKKTHSKGMENLYKGDN